MELHGELSAGTVLGRQSRPQDYGFVDGVLARLDITAHLSDLVATWRVHGAAICGLLAPVQFLALVVAEVTHSADATGWPAHRTRLLRIFAFQPA